MGAITNRPTSEVDHDRVEVVKVCDMSLEQALLEDIPREAVVGYESVRTPLSLAHHIRERCQALIPFDAQMHPRPPFASLPHLPTVENLEGKVDISRVDQKMERVYEDFGPDEALYLCALDQIAWISNLRGYHLPHLSSFLGRAIVTYKRLYLFVDPSLSFESTHPMISIHRAKEVDLADALKGVLEEQKGLKALFYDESSINAGDYALLVDLLGEERFLHRPGGLIPYLSIKDDKEIVLIEKAFERSNRAIVDVMRWVRTAMAYGREISERDIYDKTTEYYRARGAKTQSFNTISGVGAHSSIIHFSSPEAGLKVEGEDVVLLDSGGYFESGLATDTTRTFLAHAKAAPNPKMVEIFTLALKGALALQNAVVEEGTDGATLDAIARTPIREGGYDYAHGTGHGVGIYVHEGGINLSTRSSHLKIKAGQVFSVEPGIYLPGWGGVRHENIVVAENHPQRPGWISLRPLTWIEFDEALIDRSRLSSQELEWLDDYQKGCRKRGNTFLCADEKGG